MAWDGTNLYVTDPFNRRVLVFTIGEETFRIPAFAMPPAATSSRSGPSRSARDPKENDEVTIKIADAREYKYKAGKDENIAKVITALVEAINAGAGDPEVFASPNITFNQLILTAKASSEAGNSWPLPQRFRPEPRFRLRRAARP